MKTVQRALHVLVGTAIVIGAGFGTAYAASTSKQPLLIPVSPDEPLYIGAPKSKHKAVRTAKVSSAAPAVQTPATVSLANIQQRHAFAVDRALAGDGKGALAMLKELSQLSMPAEERDRVFLSMGRIHYQLGNDREAIESYKQVRLGSPSWLEALEERAWAHMRAGQPQEALAALKTVLTPIFSERTLSEPYFLAALAQLRVCDYQSVLKTLDLFKTRFRDKVRAWEKSKDSDAVARLRLRETSETIQKLNLVEAEVIQRLYIDENGQRKDGAPPKIAKDSDQLSFPMDSEMDSKEVWLDEVDNYRVSVKGCQAPMADNQIAKKEKAL